MAGARVIGMALGAVGPVWAARCLGPHNLGISGMVQNIVAQAALLLGAIYPMVLVREYKNAETTEERHRLVRISTSFQLGLAIIFSTLAAVALKFHIFPADYDLAGWFFIPILLISAIQPAWVFQAAEKQHFQSLVAVLQPALKTALYLLVFRPGMSASADLAVITVVSAVLTVIYWFFVYKFTSLRGSVIDLQVFQQAKELMQRSKWLFVSSLTIYVYTTLEQPLLGWFYSVEELGKYRTAVTVSGIVQGFFSIILSVLYPRFLEWKKRGEEVLWNRQIKLVGLFVSMGAIGIVLTFSIVPHIYPYIFGAAYQKAALPCAILLASKIVVLPSGTFYFGLMTDHQYDKVIFSCTFGAAFFSLLLNLLFIPRFGMYAAALINLLSETMLFAAYTALTLNRVGKFSFRVMRGQK